MTVKPPDPTQITVLPSSVTRKNCENTTLFIQHCFEFWFAISCFFLALGKEKQYFLQIKCVCVLPQ